MRLALAAVALAAATALAAPPLPPAVAADHPGLKELGEGTLRFLGIRVYDGSVWIPGDAFSATGLFALELRYSMPVTGAKLAALSVEEWKKQDKPVPPLEDVRGDLERLLTARFVDQALDRWLGDQRTQTSIVFKTRKAPRKP